MGGGLPVGAVWGYSLFLKNGNKRAYILGLLSAGVGVFMKESILPLPLLLPFVALAMGLSAKPGYSFSLQEIIRLATKGIMPALPFALPSLLFVGLRFATGGIGGYKGAVTDYNHFFWDALTSAGQQFLLPLNRSVFPRTFVQVVGAATGLLSVIALAAWGRRRLPMLGLALVWSLFFLLPVLNLIVIPNPNVLGNRVLYLSLLGVCMGIATLALGALESTRFSIFARALLLAGLVAIVPLTWVQLGPWVQSSRQTRHIVDELGSLIIDAPGRRLDMNVKNLPREYKGSYVFWNALDDALAVFYNQYVLLSTNTRLDATGSGGSSAGSYDLAFSLGDDDLFHVSKISGQVAASLIPPGGQRVWDLSGCRGPVPGLRAVDAAFDCVKEANAPPRPGTSYAVFAPKSADGQLILDGIAVDTAGYSWLRLAVCARYRGLADSLGEWFWMSDNSSWDAAYSKRFVLNSAGAWRVYLTYLPVEQLRSGVNGLRFDPTNVKESVDIQWISLDLVK